MEKVFERRTNKEQLKELVLTKKDEGVNMLKEIHDLREANVRANRERNQ